MKINLRRISIFILFLSAAFHTLARAQVWNYVFTGPGDDYVYDVVETADGGFVMAGGRFDVELNDTVLLLARVNSVGIMQWTQTYGIGSARSLVALEDNSVVVAGYTQGAWLEGPGVYGLDTIVMKVDANANVVWSTAMESPESNDAQAIAHSYNAGGFVVAGGKGLEGQTMYLAHFNRDGAMSWVRDVDSVQGGGISFVLNHVPGTGYEALAMTSGFEMYPSPVYALVFDERGKLVDSGEVSSPDFGMLYHGKFIPDGGLIVTGVNFSDPADMAYYVPVFKQFKSDGGEGAVHFGATDMTESFVDSDAAINGFAVLIQKFTDVGSDANVLLLALDGSVKRQLSFGDIIPSHIRQTSDGGHVVIGYIQGSYESGMDIWAARIGPHGECEGCK